MLCLKSVPALNFNLVNELSDHKPKHYIADPETMVVSKFRRIFLCHIQKKCAFKEVLICIKISENWYF